MRDLSSKKILIVATDGFEQSELEKPLAALRGAGATVDVASLKPGDIKGWEKGDWGRAVPVDRLVSEVRVEDYDGVVLPGGVMNPDKLRVEPAVVDLIRQFWRRGKVVAAVCHAPWLLAEAGLLKDRRVTSYKSIRTDIINAGGLWEDSPVVTDQGLVTSRNPGDLDAFSDKIAEELLEGGHERRAA